jgi:hypothetical protein
MVGSAAPMDESRDSRRGGAARTVSLVLLAALPSLCVAEKFVPLGVQPDGAEVSVQASPPGTISGGMRQGWFRTTPKAPQSIADERGVKQKYTELLALNVADCPVHRMGAASLLYRDAKGKVVARFDLPPKSVEYVDIKPGTLGASMLEWLCATPKSAAPPPPFPGPGSPFK